MPSFTHNFDATVLREYDIRGIVGQTLHPADAFAIGRCFASMVRRDGGTSVAVGYDGRLSSPELEAELARSRSQGERRRGRADRVWSDADAVFHGDDVTNRWRHHGDR
jgi:hypothetical protein